MTEKKKWGKALKILKSKYTICTLAFLVFFVFLDSNGILSTYSLHKNNRLLKQQKKELEEGIREDSLNVINMKNNSAEIERFGRENYYMKRKNEDVFIVVEDED